MVALVARRYGFFIGIACVVDRVLDSGIPRS